MLIIDNCARFEERIKSPKVIEIILSLLPGYAYKNLRIIAQILKFTCYPHLNPSNSYEVLNINRLGYSAILMFNI